MALDVLQQIITINIILRLIEYLYKSECLSLTNEKKTNQKIKDNIEKI